MFFQQIAALAENLDVQVRIMKKGESLTVSIVPADATAIKPLSLTGTAAELDEGFLEAIAAPISATSISEQVDAYKKDLQKELEEKKKAAAEEVEKKAAAEDTKPAKKTRATKAKAKEEPKEETPPPPEDTKTEKPVGNKEAYAPTEAETEKPAEENAEPQAEVEKPGDVRAFNEKITTAFRKAAETVADAPVAENVSKVAENVSESGETVVKTEETVTEAVATEFLPAEPAAAPEPDDSFFAPPPSMRIPIFD